MARAIRELDVGPRRLNSHQRAHMYRLRNLHFRL